MPHLYADTYRIGTASFTLENAADAFGAGIAGFAAVAGRADAASAFGNLGAMAEAGDQYAHMTSTTVDALHQLREVLRNNATKLDRTRLAYEQADDSAAEAGHRGAVNLGGARVVALDFGDIQDARDAVRRLASRLVDRATDTSAQATHMLAHWNSTAAGAAEERYSSWIGRAAEAAADVAAYEQQLDTALRDYRAAEQYNAALWPSVPPAPPQAAPSAAVQAVPTDGWGRHATAIAQVALMVLGLPWPGGSPNDLREMSGGWRSMADRADAMIDTLRDTVAALDGTSWRGAAAAACREHLLSQIDHSEHAPSGMRDVATCLDNYAADVESIVGTIVKIALEIAAMIGIGRLVGFFTAGLGDLAASAGVAARVARIKEWLAALVLAAGRFGAMLRTIATTVGTLRALLATLAEEARIQFSLTRVGSAARALDAVATRVGGPGYRAMLSDMAGEWRREFAATAVQQLVTQGHVDVGLSTLNATVVGARKGGQLKLEGASDLLKGWQKSHPILYGAGSRAILTDVAGVVIDPITGKDAQSTAVDLAVRPLYAAPRGALSNHPVLGPRRPGISDLQSGLEQTSLKSAEKVGRTWTEDQLLAPDGGDLPPADAFALPPE